GLSGSVDAEWSTFRDSACVDQVGCGQSGFVEVVEGRGGVEGHGWGAGEGCGVIEVAGGCGSTEGTGWDFRGAAVGVNWTADFSPRGASAPLFEARLKPCAG